MRVLFYSKTCDFCLKLIEYINKNNLNEYFNMICIDDDTTKIPKNITVVPTIIDEEIEAPLEGKKAFEYVINQKYFNHPTNNTEFTKNGVPKPTIEEDKKAVTSKSGSGFIFVSDENNTNEKDERSNFDKVFNLNKELQMEAQQKSQPYQPSQTYQQSQPSQPSQPSQTSQSSQQFTGSSQQKLLLTRQQFQQQLQPVKTPAPPPALAPAPPKPTPAPPKPQVQQSAAKTMDALMRLKGRR
jgi:hypothetical protein